jgi:hypothetical protein
MTNLYSNFKNSVYGTWFIYALKGGLLLGAIPVFNAIISAVLGIDTEGAIAAIIVSAIGGAAGGTAFYFTRTMGKKVGWGFYLTCIIIMEAYIITVILGIFVAVALCPYLLDESLEELLFRPVFHLALHMYGLFLVTVGVGATSLQKFIRRKKTGN